ncbi:hypothetical protein [uncultured Clostridium sp.]|jgi:hypothetical protein|uniref:hypothetical protein n=1 Tax=uncultured Clostridium sp. TaxID=59620 RepID=UPI002729FD2B|nr:hypothetical protein [uncultured Clostridium sp.]MCI9064206.1 hypothetical protein [Clostridia bacterium]
MKVGEILRNNQKEVYKELKRRKKVRRGNKKKKEALSFSDIEKIMKHDSHTRGRGGAIKQKHGGII